MTGIARGWGRWLLAAVFVLLSLNALSQVALAFAGRLDDPALLTVLQALVGTAGMLAAVGIWRTASWAGAAAVSHGVVTAVMLISLPPLLALDRESRAGIWLGAALMLMFGVVSGWAARRWWRRDLAARRRPSTA